MKRTCKSITQVYDYREFHVAIMKKIKYKHMKTTAEYLMLLHQFKESNAALYGIKRLGIFGSVARGEQKNDSDIDICVEMDNTKMFYLVHIKEGLENVFKCNVDIVRLRDSMDSFLRSKIEKEGLYV